MKLCKIVCGSLGLPSDPKKEIFPSLIAAGATIASSVMGMMSRNTASADSVGAMLRQIEEQNWENERIRGWQSYENNLNRDYASRMQDAVNAFSALEAQKSRDFERAFWLERFAAENAYNDPSAQMQRLIQAGINPAAVFGQGTNSSAIGSSPSSPSAHAAQPSLGHAAFGSSAGFSGAGSFTTLPPYNIASDIKNIADAFGSVARAGLDKAQEKSTLGKLGHEISNLMADAKYKEAMASYTDVQKQMDEAKLPYAARTAAADYVGALLRNDQSAADAALKRAEGILADEKSSRLRIEWPLLRANLEKTGQLIVEQQNTEKSKQVENYASAEEHKAGASLKTAEAQTENETRSAKVVLGNAQAAIADAQAQVESNPSIVQKKLDAVGKALDLDVVKSSAEYQEMKRKYNYLNDVNNFRGNINGRLIDDYLTYLTTTLGNILSGIGAAALK